MYFDHACSSFIFTENFTFSLLTAEIPPKNYREIYGRKNSTGLRWIMKTNTVSNDVKCMVRLLGKGAIRLSRIPKLYRPNLMQALTIVKVSEKTFNLIKNIALSASKEECKIYLKDIPNDSNVRRSLLWNPNFYSVLIEGLESISKLTEYDYFAKTINILRFHENNFTSFSTVFSNGVKEEIYGTFRQYHNKTSGFLISKICGPDNQDIVQRFVFGLLFSYSNNFNLCLPGGPYTIDNYKRKENNPKYSEHFRLHFAVDEILGKQGWAGMKERIEFLNTKIKQSKGVVSDETLELYYLTCEILNKLVLEYKFDPEFLWS